MASSASTDGEHTPYDDLPLNSHAREIRVLIIEESQEDELVRCSMKVISLERPSANFIALSYVWGAPTDMTTILVNGLPVIIPNNLHSCLQQLRRNSPSHVPLLGPCPMTLWADSICINQQHMSERIQQVQMMGDIYSSTSKVLVWLGEGTPYTDAALDLLCSPGFLEKRKEMNPPHKVSRAPSEDEIMVDVVMHEDLHRRKWWQRLWVRQEFVLPSEDPIFCCGAKVITWSHLLDEWHAPPRAADFLELREKWERWRSEVFKCGNRNPTGIDPLVLDRARDEHHSARRMPLGEVIRDLLQRSAATNPRDYIYGLLGLLESEDARQITVDYRLEPMNVFQQAGRLLWNDYTEDTLSELMPVLTFHGAENGFPSWVPDFALQSPRSWTDHLSVLFCEPWQKNRIRKGTRLDEEEKVLELEGILFDVVKTAAIPPDVFYFAALIAALKEVEQSLSEALAHSIPAENALASLNALRNEESLLQTLTKIPFEDSKRFPGLTDEQVLAVVMGRETSITMDDATKKDVLFRVFEKMRLKVPDSRILVSKYGFAGIGVPEIEAGDVIVMFYGSSIPMVLRPFGDSYRIVGSAYVSGLMNPRLLDTYYEQGYMKALETTFKII